MNTPLCAAKVTAIVALASLALTLTTTSIAFGRMRIPGTTLPDGGVYTGGGGPVTEPDDPNKPRKPDGPFLDEATPTSIRFHWIDTSSYELGYELYRGPAFSGPWTQLAVWGPGNGQTMSYTDYAVSRDTRYYYKVRVYNYYGESSAIQTFATIDGRVNISRAQLRLRTANVADADTDDDVNVSLKDYDNGGTWLDYGRDDFERGDEFTYELLLDDLSDGIHDLSEIDHIYLLKPGSDGWCIESLALLINGQEIYTQGFGSTSSTCHWLDNEGGSQTYFVVGRETLRAHPLWQNFQQPIPSLFFSREDLEHLIEGRVGDTLHDDIYVDLFPLFMGTVDPYWGYRYGDRYVEVSKKDDRAVHVDLDFGVDIPAGTVDVDLDFDLRLTGICRAGDTPARVKVTIENVTSTADFDWLTEALTLWFINLAEDGIGQTIAKNVENSFPKFDDGFPIDDQRVSCVTPSVDDNGNIFFNVTFVPSTGGTYTTGTGTIGGTYTTGTGTIDPKVIGTIGNITTKAVVK